MDDARLTIGAVAVLPDAATETALPYLIEASPDGTTWGNPQAVITSIQSRLQDGSLSAINSYDNRQIDLYLRVRSSTFDGLGAAEAALTAEEQRDGYNTLTWTPSAALAVTSVFDVVTMVLDYDFDDQAENYYERHFVMKMACLPFPRSLTEVVATAAPNPGAGVTPTITTVDNCSATTGWTGLASGNNAGTLNVVAGAVRIQGYEPNQAVVLLSRSGAIDLGSSSPYLVIDYKVEPPNPNVQRTVEEPLVGAYFTGNPVPAVMLLTSRGPSPDNAGFTRAYYVLPAGTASTTIATFQLEDHFSALIPGPYSADPNIALSIAYVAKANGQPSTSTRRQLQRSIPVAGTVRTQGRLSVQHETAALGEVLTYAYKDTSLAGYVPNLRQYLASSDTTDNTDTTLYSGGLNKLATPWVAAVPASNIVQGTHRLYARLRNNATPQTAARTITVVVETRIGSASLPGAATTTVSLVVAPGAGVFGIFDLGSISLPSTLLALPTNGTVRISIQEAGTDLYIDEAWIFNVGIGTLAHVDCGSGAPSVGGPSKRLWLDPATVTSNGREGYFRGHTADRSDAFYPAAGGVKGGSPLVFEAGVTQVFTACAALDAAVELRHFPRFRHNVRAVA